MYISGGFASPIFLEILTIDSLLPTLNDISRDALGGIEPDYLDEVLEQVNSMLLLMSPEGIVGFSGFDARNIEKVGLVLDQPVSMIRKKYQKMGHGTEIIRVAAARNPQARYFTFATQNPAEVLSVERALNPEFIAPLDKSYADESGLMFDLMRIAQAHHVRVDPVSGVNQGVYRERFGDYEVDLENPRIVEIENKFQNAGLDRDRGDRMFMMARLHTN